MAAKLSDGVEKLAGVYGHQTYAITTDWIVLVQAAASKTSNGTTNGNSKNGVDDDHDDSDEDEEEEGNDVVNVDGEAGASS